MNPASSSYTLKINKIISFILLFCLSLSVSSALAGGGHEEGGKFDPGKMITGHISDAHDWHLWGEGASSVSIPLPVILYSSNKGLEVFMSSAFHHGHEIHNGYALKEGKIVAVNEMEGLAETATINEEATSGLWDFSITKNVTSLFISCIILLFMFISVAKAYHARPGLAPKGFQGLIEPLVIFVRDDIAKSSIGEKKYKKFLPYLLTAFFFIWLNNLLGLVPIFPGGVNLTGSISITLTLAMITFILVLVNGNKHYWHHIFAMPGVPGWVLFLLTPIEILGVFLRPFVLMIRLFANITAGHIIALSFFSLIFIFGEMSTGAGIGAAVFSIAFTVFMTCLELLVAFLQAYVFTLLSAIYIGAAVEEAHHDSHKHDAKVEEALIV
ncbi:MAG: F0F1 ATP synthase subunit A [Bacteroidetes bacterium]|nr:F0F1 ATP synthase subunit A [Bacteroidota bacterium]